MKAFVLAIAAVASLSLIAAPAQADNVVYQFPAIRGDLAQCVWFDDNLNDRSESALIHQTDLIYNLKALPPGAPVTVGQTATNKYGTQIAELNLSGTKLCAGLEAVRPGPLPSQQPALP